MMDIDAPSSRTSSVVNQPIAISSDDEDTKEERIVQKTETKISKPLAICHF